MDLNTIWFLLVAVLIAGYAVLDGFDLGVGVLHLFARDERERRLHMSAIAPVWDGNEVWLLTGGGALFAAFPAVYATVFSGFYLAIMLLLFALILRAVSLEFHHQLAHPGWRRLWDLAFGIGSLLPALLFGVAVGNVLRGVPIDAGGHFAGTFLGLLNPYALLTGLLSLTAFVMHGAAYLRGKVDGELAARLGRVTTRAWAVFVVLFAAATAASFAVSPSLWTAARERVLTWALAVVFVAAAVAFAVWTRRDRRTGAFVASAALIVAMIGLAGVSLYPTLVPAYGALERSLTIYNSASSPTTQGVMLVIALVGMPLVIAYTFVIYRIFRGKLPPDASGYGAAPASANRR